MDLLLIPKQSMSCENLLCGYQVVILKMCRAATVIIKSAVCHVNEGFNSAGIKLYSR